MSLGTVFNVPGVSGWFAVGAETTDSHVTWDCWKPILRETSTVPSSRGVYINELAQDPRVKAVELQSFSTETEFVVRIVNAWDEEFHVAPVVLPDGLVACHATAVV